MHISSSDPAASVRGHPLLELNLQRPVHANYRLLMNGTLVVQKASELDEGGFVCEADNGVSEPLVAHVTLTINGKISAKSGMCWC